MIPRLCHKLTSASDDLTPLALWGAYVVPSPTKYVLPLTSEQDRDVDGCHCMQYSGLLAARCPPFPQGKNQQRQH